MEKAAVAKFKVKLFSGHFLEERSITANISIG
jgi:hypothetical protein